jgi:hypothetical protein
MSQVRRPDSLLAEFASLKAHRNAGSRRAGEREDELRPTAITKLRGGVRRSRDWVIAHDWHNRPILGPVLRRINRHLP